MKTLVLDFETYYDKDYSLSKCFTLEYVRDPRFKIHGVAVKEDDQRTVWLPEPAFRSFIEGCEPSETEIVCHNTYFDGLILFEHYGFVPRYYRDTLSMARGLLPNGTKIDLDSLASMLGLGEKIPEVLGLTKGVRELDDSLFMELGNYAINDVKLTDRVYQTLKPAVPDDELALIDLTLRWGCRPVLHVDIPRAQAELERLKEERTQTIHESGVSLAVLSSNPKFLEELQGRGIDVPLKPNPKGEMIPALGKNDLGFRRMVADHPEHRTLFEGRLAAKSTLEITRIKRIIDIGSRGTLPMPLKYYGAHTGRWSGADGLNPQNFKRESELRRSVIAPPGYVMLVADLKQIELRLNIWYCQEQYWLDVLRSGKDVYSVSAAHYFNVPLEAVTDEQRFFGKTMELGLGYGMGHKTFKINNDLKGLKTTVDEAIHAVESYRFSHSNIQRKWNELSNNIIGMYQEGFYKEDGPVTFKHQSIWLPNNMALLYENLEPREDGGWTYGVGNNIRYIYGGKMLENIIQALGRVVLGEQLLKIEAAGITTVSSTHDEPIMVVRKKDAAEAADTVRKIMKTPPDWAPDLPMGVDIGWAREYSK